jgi:hypothetical protein
MGNLRPASIEESAEPSQILAEIWQASFESTDAAVYQLGRTIEIALRLPPVVGSRATAVSREVPRWSRPHSSNPPNLQFRFLPSTSCSVTYGVFHRGGRKRSQARPYGDARVAPVITICRTCESFPVDTGSEPVLISNGTFSAQICRAGWRAVSNRRFIASQPDLGSGFARSS